MVEGHAQRTVSSYPDSVCASLCIQLEKDQEPMWPMQWPSSSKVASVRRLSLLLRQLSGMARRDTVVSGTRHSCR